MGVNSRTYYLIEHRVTKYVSIYLNDDNLKPEVEIGTPSGHAVLNEMLWFILVILKSDIPKNEAQELGDPQNNLSLYCGQYNRITRTRKCI